MKNVILLTISFLFLFIACDPDGNEEQDTTGQIQFEGQYIEGRLHAKANKDEIGLISLELSTRDSRLILFKGRPDLTDFSNPVFLSINLVDSILWAQDIKTQESRIPSDKRVLSLEELKNLFPSNGYINYHNTFGADHVDGKHRNGHVFSTGIFGKRYDINIARDNGLGQPDSTKIQTYYTYDRSVYDSANVLRNYNGAWLDWMVKNDTLVLLEARSCHDHSGVQHHCYQKVNP